MQERIDAMEMDGKTRGATLNRAQLLSIEQRSRDRLRAIQANAELTPSNEVIAAGWLTVV
jgi:hypothetical protein